MELDYFLFMNEAEGTGLVNTKLGRMNAAVKEFVNLKKCGYDINDDRIQDLVFRRNNLRNLNKNEELYIKKEVEKRI